MCQPMKVLPIPNQPAQDPPITANMIPEVIVYDNMQTCLWCVGKGRKYSVCFHMTSLNGTHC